MIRNRTSQSRFQPRFEALEERSLMAVTASFTAATGVLKINGTAQVDNVRIIDNGHPTNAGAIQVFSNGALIFSSPAVGSGTSAVTQIDANMGTGNDKVDYSLTGDLVFVSRTLNMRLQGDNDRFTANVGGSLGLGGALHFDVNGGEGNDRMTGVMTGDVYGPFFGLPASKLQFNFDGRKDDDTMAVLLAGAVKTGGTLGVDMRGTDGKDRMSIAAISDVDVEAGATLDLAMRGQAGDDRGRIDFEGEVDGTLKILAAGGPGKDNIAVDVLLETGSTGTVTATVNGGPDDDNLTLTTRKENAADTATITATVNGGPGTDKCKRTANVTTTGCETDSVVA